MNIGRRKGSITTRKEREVRSWNTSYAPRFISRALRNIVCITMSSRIARRRLAVRGAPLPVNQRHATKTFASSHSLTRKNVRKDAMWLDAGRRYGLDRPVALAYG